MPTPAPSADGPEGHLGSGVRLRLHPLPISAHSACWQSAQDPVGDKVLSCYFGLQPIGLPGRPTPTTQCEIVERGLI